MNLSRLDVTTNINDPSFPSPPPPNISTLNENELENIVCDVVTFPPVVTSPSFEGDDNLFSSKVKQSYSVLIKEWCNKLRQSRLWTSAMEITINRIRIKAITKIQRIVRGRLGRKRFHMFKLLRYREKIQDRYNSDDGVYRFYFEQNGAAMIIQRWFHNLPWRVKLVWHRKYAKLWAAKKVAKEERHRRQIEEFQRRQREMLIDHQLGNGGSKGVNLVGSYIRTLLINSNPNDNFIMDSVSHINRIIRGFLSRRRVILLRKKIKAARVLQKIARGYIIRRYKFPGFGIRSRSLIIKTRRWHHIQHESATAVNNIIIINNSNSNWKEKRRHAVFFKHLKIGDAKNIAKLDKCALKISLLFRKFKAAKIFRKMVERRDVLRVFKIQRWYLTWKRRHKVRKSLEIIQPTWREKIGKHLVRVHAALRIQTRWRVCAAKLFIRNMLWKKVRGIHLIQGFYLRRRAFRRARVKTAEKRAVQEQLLAGEFLYNRSVHLLYVDYLWSGIKKVHSIDVPHELQKFLIICAQQQTTLDANRVLKISRDSPGLLDDVLDSKIIELQFAKAKAPNTNRLGYSNFLDLCENLAAIKFLRILPTEVGGKQQTPEQESSPENMNNNLGNNSNGEVKNDVEEYVNEDLDDDDDDEGEVEEKGGGNSRKENKVSIQNSKKMGLSTADLMSSFKFGRLVGRPALITKFVFVHFKPLKEFSKAINELKSKAADKLANKFINDRVFKLQKWLRKRLDAKRMIRVRNLKIENKIKELKNHAATIIQCLIKGFIGRRFLMRIAQTLYSKFIDTDTQLNYWYNPRTKASFWKKPKLLGALDCGKAIVMPTPEEQYSVSCNGCEVANSTVFCDECNEAMCGPCFSRLHKAGHRRFHSMIELINCIQCEFQAGTKFCIQCDDCYCDNCFKHMHSKGRLRLHISKWECETCMECDDRAAKWCKDDLFSGIKSQLCGVCYANNYGEVDESDPTVSRIKFLGKSVREFRSIKLENESKKQVAAAYAVRQAELFLKKKYNNALLIQRIFRGYRKRKSIDNFITKRRAFLDLRKKEEPIRQSVPYQLLAFFGFAPALQSDTTLERAKNLFPTYMHSIVGECIDNHWPYACSIINAEDEYKARNVGSTKVAGKIAANMALQLAKRDFDAADEVYTKAKEKHMNARSSYREAKSKAGSKGMEAKIKKLFEAVQDAEKSEKSSAEKMEVKAAALEEANKRIAALVPPKGLRQIISERRKTGLPMPFTIDVVKGSFHALTRWPDDESTPDLNNPPRRWEKKLKLGDAISVNGTVFRLVQRQIFDNNFEDDDKSDKSDSESEGSGDDHSDAEEDNKTAESEINIDGAKDPVEWTEEHLVLDRPWVLDDARELQIYKVIPEVFFIKPVTHLVTFGMETYPIQKAVAITSINLYKIAALNRWLSTLFDEDSDTRVNLIARAERYEKYRDGVLSHSRSIVQMSWDFSLRRNVGKQVWGFGKIVYKSFRLLTKCARQYAKVVADPYDDWEKSTAKESIIVHLEIAVGKKTKDIVLGNMSMDLKAPCDVMRTYVRRNFRDKLNEQVGEGFCFYGSINGKATILQPELDIQTYSKDFITFIIDNKTMEGNHHLTLVPNPLTKEKIDIPAFEIDTEAVLNVKKKKEKKRKKEHSK